jgi:hypothetical protein
VTPEPAIGPPSDSPRTIVGYVQMSAQLAAEVKRIADAEAEEVRLVGEILDAHFREVADG